MAKRVTKAELILGEARRRVQRAEQDVANRSAALRAAEAGLEAHRDSLAALENSLTPKPRKKSTPTTQVGLPVEKEPICGVCGNVKDFEDHIKGSPRFHEFDTPKIKKAAK